MHYPKRISDFISLGLAFIALCIAGGGWWWVFANRGQFGAPSLWPMPDLFLLDWTAVGLIGLLAVYFGQIRGAWLVVGALIPLFIISAWSFGLMVFFAFLFMLAAALLVSARPGQNWLEALGLLALGAVLNLVLVYTFILFNNRVMSG